MQPTGSGHEAVRIGTASGPVTEDARPQPILVVHAAHATAHSAHSTAAAARGSLRFLLLGDQALGREQKARDRGGVLQRGLGDLGRIDDAGLDQVFVLAGAGVEPVGVLAFLDLVDHHGAFPAAVARDDAQRLFQGAAHDLDADGLVGVVALQALQHGDRADQGHAAAGHDALFHGRAGRVQGVSAPAPLSGTGRIASRLAGAWAPVLRHRSRWLRLLSPCAHSRRDPGALHPSPLWRSG